MSDFEEVSEEDFMDYISMSIPRLRKVRPGPISDFINPAGKVMAKSAKGKWLIRPTSVKPTPAKVD